MSSVGAAGANPEDFEAIERAVMESQRGRWFLSEFARRNRTSETTAVLNAIGKLESVVKANQEMIAARLAKALDGARTDDTKIEPAAPTGLEPRHLKFFKQDEEIFEAVAPAAPALKVVEPKPEVARGAKLVIRRRTDTPAPATNAPADPAAAAASAPVAAEAVAPEPQPPVSQPALAEPEPKRRIVIIRHKAGEEIDLPFQEEARSTA